MGKSVFNTEFQQESLSSKIVVSLERISEVFKSLLWEYAKKIDLSPIQIQILIFIAYHKNELCNVSHLAKEFNITKPTISDAVKVLENKKLICKKHSANDSRSYIIILTNKGKEILNKTDGFAKPLQSEIEKIDADKLEPLYSSLNKLIYQLNLNGILSVQRICYACKFYEERNKKQFCNLLNIELQTRDLRVDCPEFE